MAAFIGVNGTIILENPQGKAFISTSGTIILEGPLVADEDNDASVSVTMARRGRRTRLNPRLKHKR